MQALVCVFSRHFELHFCFKPPPTISAPCVFFVFRSVINCEDLLRPGVPRVLRGAGGDTSAEGTTASRRARARLTDGPTVACRSGVAGSVPLAVYYYGRGLADHDNPADGPTRRW